MKNENEDFFKTVRKIKLSMIKNLREDKSIQWEKKSLDQVEMDSLSGAIVFALADLTGNLAASADLPPSAIFQVMLDGYETQRNRGDEVIH
jgi:acyl-coenzyme A thioesterase PaaI-like protein